MQRTPKRYPHNPGTRAKPAPEVRQDRPALGPQRVEPARVGRDKGPGGQEVKSRYVSVIESIASAEGTTELGYVVPPDATLSECIGYAREYVVRRQQEQPHYRYEKYLTAVRRCMQEFPFDRDTPTAMQLDLGAGPGLFTWVFWDWAQSETMDGKRRSLDLFGYDHAPEMARLARRVWGAFGLPCEYRCLASQEEVYANVWPQGPPTNVLITLGHSLIQVHRHGGLEIFAEMCEAVASLDRRARLVAVDAHGRGMPREFDSAWEEFVSMMRDSRVRVSHRGRSERVATVELLSGPWRR